MSDRPNHNSALHAVILIPQSREKDRGHEGCDTLERKCAPTSYERFLAPLGMTLRKII